MKTPDRNYLAAQNKNLIRAGDTLAFLASNLSKMFFSSIGGDADLEEALRDWKQAKENLMGLAGKRTLLISRQEPEGKLDGDAQDQARRQGKSTFDAEMAAL